MISKRLRKICLAHNYAVVEERDPERILRLNHLLYRELFKAHKKEQDPIERVNLQHNLENLGNKVASLSWIIQLNNQEVNF